MAGKWMCLDRIRDIQVVPLDDLVLHEYVGCVCCPRIENVLGEDGSVAVSMVVHHSLDGRELSE